MNRKGFTLIEVLAVVVIIGLLGIFVIPSLITNIENAKKTSYDTLIKNIVTASQAYYEECEYGDLSDSTKYGTYACKIENKKIITTLETLANTGFLKVNDIKQVNNKEIKVVLNPTNDKDISKCSIKITKEVSNTFKVTYKIEPNTIQENCPVSY